MARKKASLFALREPLPRSTATVIGLLAPILVAAVWCVLTYGGFMKPDFLPSPTEVLRGTLQLFLQYDLWDAILISTWRITQAFLLAAALALPLGVLMGSFEPVNRFFEPIVAPLRYMPISGFIRILILWFGIYEKEKIAFLFLGVFVYLLPVVVTAIRAVPGGTGADLAHPGSQPLAGDPHGSPAGGPARDLRLVPGDERHLCGPTSSLPSGSTRGMALATSSSWRAPTRRRRGRSPACW